MKLFITVGAQALSGYTTIDPAGGEGKTSCDFRSLDSVCGQAEATEICAPEMMDYIHSNDIMNVLKNWVSKLRHGGRIIVGGTDLYEVSKGVVSGQLDTVSGNKTLYGNAQLFPFVKIGMYTRHDIESVLLELGLKIIHKRVNNRCYVVEAARD